MSDVHEIDGIVFPTEEEAREMIGPQRKLSAKEKQFFGKALCKRLERHLADPSGRDLDVMRVSGVITAEEYQLFANEDPHILAHMAETERIGAEIVASKYPSLFRDLFPAPSSDAIAQARFLGVGEAPSQADRLVKEIERYYTLDDKLTCRYTGQSYYSSTLIGLSSYVFQGFVGLFIEEALSRVPDGMTEREYAVVLHRCLTSKNYLHRISAQFTHYLEEREFLQDERVQDALEALPEPADDVQQLFSEVESLLIPRLLERFQFSMGEVEVEVMLDDFSIPEQGFDGSKQRSAVLFFVVLKIDEQQIYLRYRRLGAQLGFLSACGRDLDQELEPHLIRKLEAFLLDKVADYLLDKDEDRFPALFSVRTPVQEEAGEVRGDVVQVIETPVDSQDGVATEEEVAPTWTYVPYQPPDQTPDSPQPEEQSSAEDSEALREERRKRAKVLRDKVSNLSSREVHAAFVRLFGEPQARRGKGSHRVYIHPDTNTRLTAPFHAGSDSHYGLGMLLSQLQDMGTSLEEFVAAL